MIFSEDDTTGRDEAASTEEPSQSEEKTSNTNSAKEIESSVSNDSTSEESSEEEWDDEELPEWEPLTPELVEDEAIRGDFMLRWAIVLLAFLLGFSEISDSATLVQIKTGQYIAANGWWPPANDVFSYTAEDRPWVNLSWLLDMVLAGVFSIAGAAGLSILTAVIAGITFFLVVHTSLKDISSWWGSISASLMLVVCYTQFTARPELITLLGVALVIWLLHRWKLNENSSLLWWMVPIFLVWSNLDHRMFLGLSVLILYATGEWIGLLFGRPGLPNQTYRRQLWITISCCLVASILNPFGWNSLLAPLQLYGVEYPALRSHYFLVPTVEQLEYFPILGNSATILWRSPNHHLLSGLLIVVMTVTMLILNRSKTDFGYVFLSLGFLGIAVATSHELAAACIVLGVVATLNAQEWYRTNFRQTYSVETAELLFSRGGRAVTVLAFFAFAYLAISGRLAGPSARRTGIGFNHAIEANIDGFQEILEDSFDDRPFNFLFSQGDLLIWCDQKVFIDHRVNLYHGSEEDNLIELHNKARFALRQKKGKFSVTGNSKVWKEIFDRFEVTHVMPRLTGNAPDYITYFDLQLSSDWQMTNQGSVTAVFYRTDSPNSKLKDYLKKHKVDSIQESFRVDANELAPRVDWAKSRSFYQKYLSLPKNTVPNPVQEARHYLAQIEQRRIPRTFEQALAFAYLAIRHVNEGLVQDPQNAEAFFVLGRIYSKINFLETQLALANGIHYRSEVRIFQALSALNQAAVIEPKSSQIQYQLFEAYRKTNKIDLALRALENYDNLTSEVYDLSEEELQSKQRDIQLMNELRNQVQLMSQRIEQAQSQGVNPYELAQQLYSSGFVLKALEVLESDPLLIFNTPEARRLLGLLYLEAGKLQEADEVFEDLQNIAERSGMQSWRSPAAITRLSNGDYPQAIRLWSDQIRSAKSSRMESLLSTQPMVSAPLILAGSWRDLWPGRQIVTASDSIYSLPSEVSSALWNIAICQLESGQIDDTAESLRTIIVEDPETHLRPLVRVYLKLITQEVIDSSPPSDRIPISADMFTSEPDSSAETDSRSESGKPEPSPAKAEYKKEETPSKTATKNSKPEEE